ncbi:hypothetical protein CDL15_Pgr014036 [Punica granatum]|uniref:Uncharacterized protein n=1 Tax=Punica granatum TaxID=22663 RepID=A0A218W9X5_PUNGR|nr:hypothetical protein CDL15_Pgr014036 [Punica granatum]
MIASISSRASDLIQIFCHPWSSTTEIASKTARASACRGEAVSALEIHECDMGMFGWLLVPARLAFSVVHAASVCMKFHSSERQ